MHGIELIREIPSLPPYGRFALSVADSKALLALSWFNSELGWWDGWFFFLKKKELFSVRKRGKEDDFRSI